MLRIHTTAAIPLPTPTFKTTKLTAPGGGGALITYLETNWTSGGDCVDCHMPDVGAQSPLGNRSDIMMPANLACNFCHLWWPNNIDYIDQATDNGYDTTGGVEGEFTIPTVMPLVNLSLPTSIDYDKGGDVCP